MLDTSVLLSDPGALTRFDEHEVVLPIVVLMELEGKRNHTELGWAARQALRTLEAFPGWSTAHSPSRSRSTRGRRHAAGRAKPPGPVRFTGGDALRRTNDHRILAVAHNLAHRGPSGRRGHQGPATAAQGQHRGPARSRRVPQRTGPLTTRTGPASRRVGGRRRPHRRVVRGEGGRHRRGPASLPCNTGVAPSSAARSRASVGCTTDKRVHLVRGDRSLFDVRGRSAEQRIALDLLADPSVGIVSLGGSAGTGKSVLALAAGLDAVIEQRSHASEWWCSAPSMQLVTGFLPGDKDEKMSPWGAPPCSTRSESIARTRGDGGGGRTQAAQGAAAHPHPRPQPHRHVRDHRRGPEPRAARAAHRAVPTGRGQPEWC